MKLEELLEQCAKEHLDDRTDLIDGDPDVLWPDTTLVRYMNEAERYICRRAWVLIETGIAPAGHLVLVTGKTIYTLHKSVLRVFDATPSGQLAPLGRADDINLRNPYPPSADAFDVGQAAAIAANTLNIPGPPLALASDAGTKQLRVAPTPTSDQNGLIVTLKVARMPICQLDVNKPNACPEIPEEYHLWLSDYAAGRALLQANVDSQSKAEGRELVAKFEQNVKEARQDRQRASLGGDRWVFASSTAVLR